MRIGIDYDGTIADTNAVKSQWIQANLGQTIPPEKCDRTQCVPLIGKQNYERLAAVVYEREWSLRVSPVCGVVAALNKLSKAHQLVLVTARLKHRVEFASQWLMKQGLRGLFDEILSSDGTDKATICRDTGIDILLDDDRRHIDALDGQTTLGLWFRPDSPDSLNRLEQPESVNSCVGWEAVVTVVTDLVADREPSLSRI